jgi:hypothetical protein
VNNQKDMSELRFENVMRDLKLAHERVSKLSEKQDAVETQVLAKLNKVELQLAEIVGFMHRKEST